MAKKRFIEDAETTHEEVKRKAPLSAEDLLHKSIKQSSELFANTSSRVPADDVAR